VLFTWDRRKAASHLSKHGVAFDEAVIVFADPFAIIADDAEHPERALITGVSVAPECS
jgi:uncharacterized DUF497 family protein